ncbi:GIY-YIG nuclease family protein (plasmid) [Alkalihalophilus pseudofirmus]|uniref:GIY-YIG nuclease family protein n=1 Tax=Alkalihalophilus pseudofirmus TaxID=79885 RepID=UPI00259B2BAD|nr:GIY-YIG nuclease family protein [Alkalihalophilus pseudofirmus]WEG19208.1 GIY-YIG nuclease family protein [Alkalihalophilus pseudofirmus]
MKYYVYFYYNKNNEVLYIGKTNNLSGRNADHKRNEVWFSLASHMGLIEFNNAADQTIYEIYYINKLTSHYNIKHNFRKAPTFDLPKKEIMFKDLQSLELTKKSTSKMTDKEKFISKIPKRRKELTIGEKISLTEILTSSSSELYYYKELPLTLQTSVIFGTGSISIPFLISSFKTALKSPLITEQGIEFIFPLSFNGKLYIHFIITTPKITFLFQLINVHHNFRNDRMTTYIRESDLKKILDYIVFE